MLNKGVIVKDKYDNIYVAVEVDNDVVYFKVDGYDTEIESDICVLSSAFFVDLQQTKEN